MPEAPSDPPGKVMVKTAVDAAGMEAIEAGATVPAREPILADGMATFAAAELPPLATITVATTLLLESREKVSLATRLTAVTGLYG